MNLFTDGQRRTEDAYERLGTRQPRCRQCTETNPNALMKLDDLVACHECQARKHGRSQTEAHHVAGRHNLQVAVDLPANDHRVLSDLQRDWPIDTLRNPTGSPLLKAAAALRGWLDAVNLMMDRAVGWIPRFLEWLDGQLQDAIGTRWWDAFEWDGLSS